MSSFVPYLVAASLSLAACAARLLPTPSVQLPATPVRMPAPPIAASTAPERFNLSAAPAAAVGYPMEVIDGRFVGAEDKGFSIAPEYLEGEWGLSAIGWVAGDPMQPVPDQFWVSWYSYPEDKFYEGHFALPQQRLTALLRQGYWNLEDKKQETYEIFTLCLLPKGVVVLWLSGVNQVLIGRYEGHEINYDFKRFNERANRPLMVTQERAKMPPAVQQQIKTHTLSARRWEAYLTTYPWQVAFSQPLQLETYGLAGLDASRTLYPVTSDQATAYAQALLSPQARPVPANLLLVVDAGYGRRRKIRVDAFDETETMAAFQTLHAARPAAPLTLLVETDERVTKARFFVKNDQQQLPLDKVKVAVYDAD